MMSSIWPERHRGVRCIRWFGDQNVHPLNLQSSMKSSCYEVAGGKRQYSDSDGDKHASNNDAPSATTMPTQNGRIAEEVLTTNGYEDSREAKCKTKLHRDARPADSEQRPRHQRNSDPDEGE
jgi:hypothetical protein